MEQQSGFVFVNTTNAPGLSPQSARRMRGHITKSNFAKRRARIARESRADGDKTVDTRKGIIPTSTTAMSVPSPLESSGFKTCLPSDLQMLILLTCIRPAKTPCEAAWFELVGSEPALIEASMAVGVRNWSPQPSWQWQAELHSQKALNMIIHKISCKNTHTDGFLGAVLTMAFAARQMHEDSDDGTWEVHVDGLVQVIKYRRARGIDTPQWFYNILYFDSINHVFNFPRLYHRKIIDALDGGGGGDDNFSTIKRLAEIVEKLISVRKSIDIYHRQGQVESNFVEQQMQQPLAILQYKANALCKARGDNMYIRATAQTIQLILYILWPCQSTPNLSFLAEELKDTISQLPHKPCPYMDLTSCQLIVGAVAAGHGTRTSKWFVDRFTSATQDMRSRGWDRPLGILQRGLGCDADLVAWFTMLCDDRIQSLST